MINDMASLRLLLTVKEAADMLALSERKLWELTDRRELPVVRIGRAKRYCLADLQAWVGKQRSDTE